MSSPSLILSSHFNIQTSTTTNNTTSTIKNTMMPESSSSSSSCSSSSFLLAPKDLAAVARHWRELQQQPTIQRALVEIWFCHFFTSTPQALELFPFDCQDLSELWRNAAFWAHGKKVCEFMSQALETMTLSTNHEAEVAELLQSLGRRHGRYSGMGPQYFAPMAAALLHALQQCSSSTGGSTSSMSSGIKKTNLRPARQPWTSRLQSSWKTLIGFLCLNMAKGMNQNSSNNNNHGSSRKLVSARNTQKSQQSLLQTQAEKETSDASSSLSTTTVSLSSSLHSSSSMSSFVFRCSSNHNKNAVSQQEQAPPSLQRQPYGRRRGSAGGGGAGGLLGWARRRQQQQQRRRGDIERLVTDQQARKRTSHL